MPEIVESIVASLMSDPDFHPESGRTKQESAYAVANSQAKQLSRTRKALSLAKMFPKWTEELTDLRKYTDPSRRSHEKGSGFGVHQYPAQRKHPGTASASSGQAKGPPPFPGAQWNPITHQWHKPHMSGTGGEKSGTSYNGTQYGQGQNRPTPNVTNAEPAAGYGGGGAAPVDGGAPSGLTGGGFGGDHQEFMALDQMDDDQMSGILKGCEEQVKYWEKQGYKDISNMYKAKMFEVEEELDRRAATERGRVEKNFSWKDVLGSEKDKETK